LLIALGVGLAALALARTRGEMARADLVVGSIGLLAAAGLAISAPRWDAPLMSMGVYRPAQAGRVASYAQFVRVPGGVVWRASRLENVLFYREGASASVMVGADPEGKNRWLRVDGKIDAGTGEDMATQVLLGLLPAACADSGARALVIGLGSGTTAAAVLAGGAGATDVVELEPAVVQASRFFNEHRPDPLADPRVRLTIGDARTRVLHGEGRYGIIVSEPSNPWLAGVNNLFTVDFYRRVRQRLAPDGVFCQWMQLYELSPETFRTMMASFLEVFPHGQVFSVWNAYDLLLLAVPDTRRLDFDRLNRPAVRGMLASVGIDAPERLIGHYVAPLDSLRALARGAPLNRDDRPIVEYRAPMDLIRVGRTIAQGNPPVTELLPVMDLPPAGALFSGWTTEHWVAAHVRSLIVQGQIARARDATAAAGRAGLAVLAAQLAEEATVGERHQLGGREMEQARLMLASGNQEAGRHALERAVAFDPSNAVAWFMLADRRRLGGDMDGADTAIAHGRAVASDPVQQTDGRMLAGMMALAREHPQLALEHFRAAQSLSPANARAYLFEAQTRQRAGDLAGARDAVRRGLAAIPGEPNLTSMLATLGPGK
jgi:spermidine synthase/Tfp pilus assembly protein PilF